MTVQQQLRKSVKTAHTSKVSKPSTSRSQLQKPYLPPRLKRSINVGGVKYYLMAMEYTARTSDTLLLEFKNAKLENTGDDSPRENKPKMTSKQ